MYEDLAHPGYFENRITLKPARRRGGGGGGVGRCEAYAASQTTVLHMKRPNQIESPIFVILCVLFYFYLTHLRRVASSTETLWTGLFPIVGCLVSFYYYHVFCCFFSWKFLYLMQTV